MGMIEALAAALRGQNRDTAAKSSFGQDGMAARMNGNSRDAYNRYVENEAVAGRDPLPYPQWYAQQQQQQAQGAQP